VKKTQIDLHGFNLETAIIEVFYALDECLVIGESELEIIHGYKRGQVLKNFFNSDYFLLNAEQKGYPIRKKLNSNPGKTCLIIS